VRKSDLLAELTDVLSDDVSPRFVALHTKYTEKDYKTREDVLPELKISPVVKKIQNYRNKWAQHVRRMDRHRLPHLTVKYQPCGKLSQGGPLEKDL